MERSSAAPVFVGIDVAKDRLDVHLRPSGEALAVGRDAAGLTVLVERLAELPPALVVLEATGGFEVTVAAALGAAQLPLAVVIPARSATSPAPPAGSPSLSSGRPKAGPVGPIGWTPRRLRVSPKPFGPSRGRYSTRRPARSASWLPAAASSSR